MPNTFANVPVSQTDYATSMPAARAGFRIRVYAVIASSGATATNVTFNSKGSGAGTAIGPALAFGANGGAVLPYNPFGWFDTNRGEGLTITTGAGSTQGVAISYGYIG